ncbi:AAA family ATPase [Piscirickettsia litoralis]|uniref:CobQ/CobB/MinD/ParA nucleotide binding domain-containing protein n=1 Tax=Piscirickettsia litoralis TaxID=1891921 RepID=A0ABX2ZZS8_9GAMM|nr:AAA family ATPase [Piscirickettsia litoralis]ODN40956.1 hypothetical protein BGC07_18755 [Piscirickettsia litoralis]
MPIVQIANSKGGVGKSTIACNLATALVHAGFSVVVADCDPQFSSSSWADERQDNGKVPSVDIVQKTGKVIPALRQLIKKYDFVVVDTAGHDSVEMRAALTVSDLTIVPFKPSQLDIDVLESMQELIENAQDAGNDKMKVGWMINMAAPNPRSKKLKETQSALNEADDFNLLKTVAHNRDAYVEAMSEGFGVVELKDKKAKAEMESLVKEILKLTGKKAVRHGIRAKKAVKTKKSA